MQGLGDTKVGFLLGFVRVAFPFIAGVALYHFRRSFFPLHTLRAEGVRRPEALLVREGRRARGPRRTAGSRERRGVLRAYRHCSGISSVVLRVWTLGDIVGAGNNA